MLSASCTNPFVALARYLCICIFVSLYLWPVAKGFPVWGHSMWALSNCFECEDQFHGTLLANTPLLPILRHLSSSWISKSAELCACPFAWIWIQLTNCSSLYLFACLIFIMFLLYFMGPNLLLFLVFCLCEKFCGSVCERSVKMNRLLSSNQSEC